jgi:DNA polymerase-3 subunit delta
VDTQQLNRKLKKGKPAPAYLVAGEESVLVDRALELITSRVLDEAQSDDFSLTRLDGKTTSAAEVEAAARTASLFGGRRLVVVREAQALRPTEIKKLLEYLKKPVETTTLVLVVRGAGASSKSPRLAKAAGTAQKLKKAVEKGKGIYVDCPRPKPRDLPRLAEGALAEHGLRASRDGLYALVEAVGEDLTALIQGVEKLALYVGEKGEIQAADVAEVVADTRSQSVFALTDAVAEGATDRALRVLNNMIRDGESPLVILGHLVRHFRNLSLVQSLDRKGENVERIRANLGLHPFVVKKCLMQLKRFTPPALSRHLAALAQCDLQLKRGRLPDSLALEKLVISLCGQAATCR